MSLTGDWKVVLVDDEADIRDVTAITLEDAGYRVTTAENGAEGLNIIERVSPQIVITDIRMPQMDGIQLLEAVKNRFPDIEVVVATAYGEMNLAIQALQLDASDFITKPINDEALHMALQRARERYSARRQLRDYTRILEIQQAHTVEQLARTVAFQKNLIESSMDGIVGCDADGRVVIYNRSMETLLGISRAKVLEQPAFDDLFAAGEAAKLRRALAGDQYGGRRQLFLYETHLIDGNGRPVPVQVSAAVLSDGDQASGWVFFFRDLRRIRQLEREMADQAGILHQDKMMALGRLAASVAHEINNPLSGILNYIRLMIRIARRGPLAADQQEKFCAHLDLVEKETERCSQIVSGLLTFSRKSPPSLGVVDVNDLLNRCVLLSRHKLELSQIRLDTDIAASIPAIAGDYNQLQQCVLNLVFNAIDAMPDGGILTLEAFHDQETREAVIVVKDTGRGIRAEDLPHLYEPFYTTKSEGHGIGLGLSTVFGIIQHHNGRVEVDSAPGQGAVFSLRIPVS